MHRPFVSRLGHAFCLGLLLASLPACSQSRLVVKPSDVNIDATDRYCSARIAKGQKLTVKLPTDADSKYVWRLSPTSFENDHLTMIDRQGKMNAENSVAYGDDQASDIFTFRASKPGPQTLDFIFDSQPGCPQSKTSYVTLNVEVFDAKAEALAKAEEEARIAKMHEEQFAAAGHSSE